MCACIGAVMYVCNECVVCNESWRSGQVVLVWGEELDGLGRARVH